MNRLPCALVLLLIPACAGNDTTSSSSDGLVMIDKGPATTSLYAIVTADGPVFGEPTATDGVCSYYDRVRMHGVDVGQIVVEKEQAQYMIVDPMESPESGSLYEKSTGNPVVEEGKPVIVRAARGATTLFQGDVTAPGDMTTATWPAAISRDSGATIKWTAGDGDAIDFELVVDPGNREIRCRTNDSGSFTIPPSFVSLLPADITLGTVYMRRLNLSQAFGSGGYGVEIAIGTSLNKSLPIR